MGKIEGKRSLGRPRQRWEYVTKIELQEINRRAWTGLIWPGRGIGGGLL